MTREIFAVIGGDMANAIGFHSGHQSRIMHLHALDFVLQQDCYRFERVIQIGIGTTNGKAKAVALERTGGYIPELGEVLEETTNCSPRAREFRMKPVASLNRGSSGCAE
jgi:hypothetical protein